MSQLTKNQKHILTIAASRDDGKLEPLPSNIMGGARSATLNSMNNKGIAKFINNDWVITDQGRNAINSTQGENTSILNNPPDRDEQYTQLTDKLPSTKPSQPEISQPNPKAPSKKSIILAMIGTPTGVSLDDLCTATGWKTHSVRGSISQLKTQGNFILSKKVDGERRYSMRTDETIETENKTT